MEIRIGLAGNPNCGKTTFFNILTGSNQYVGNWPGVTVEKKEGKVKGREDVTVTDLPGIYSLSPYTPEEIVARNYLVGERPDVILDIVDGTNIERNLYLTLQLIETGIPVVMAINMMDVVRKNGDKINIELLSKRLGVPIVEVSALKNQGVEEAVDLAVKTATSDNIHLPIHRFSGPVEHTLAHIEEAVIHEIPEEQQRYLAVKIFENDKEVLKTLGVESDVLNHIKRDIKLCETELDDDAESIIISERYDYITKIVKECCKKANVTTTTSYKLDKILTGKFTGLPIFALIMFGVYYVSVTLIGTSVTDWVNDVLFGEWICGGISSFLTYIGCADWLISMICDGILGGVGSVIGFAPQMAILFFFLSFLEDCGYMTRIAFVMDRLFRKFGLSGKSFIPLLIGSGCGVPGIMASKTIESDSDRRMTIITTTFIPCGAKLPIISLIGGAILGGSWWIAPSMYLIGVVAVLVSALMLKKTKLFKAEENPFVMELPSYHMPAMSGVFRHVWERVRGFIIKAGTVLVVACAVMWFLSNFGITADGFVYLGEENSDGSFISYIGSAIAFIFSPLGFGNWKCVAATLSGFFAKENIVATIQVLLTKGETVNTLFPTAVAGFSFLVFNLLNSPCVAAISAMAKEMNSKKWFFFALLYQNVFAYLVCLMIYQIGGLFTGTLSFNFFTPVAFLVLLLFIYQLIKKDKKVRAIS